MSLLLTQTETDISHDRRSQASRSVRPEIPSKPSSAPKGKPTTSDPVKPGVKPGTGAAGKPADSTNPATSWLYRGIEVDSEMLRADQLLAQHARESSDLEMTYRGITVDPIAMLVDQIETAAARKRSSAMFVYRGILVVPVKTNTSQRCRQ